MTVDLKTLRIGDTIIFANGTNGICSICYQNGPGYFIRWDVFGEDGKKRDWSGSDSYCCSPSIDRNGRRGWTSPEGKYSETPEDIVNIIKPPLEALQDEVARLKKEIKELQQRESDAAV